MLMSSCSTCIVCNAIHTSEKKEEKKHAPGDSSRDLFHPLVGGHLTIGSLNHHKKVTKNCQAPDILILQRSHAPPFWWLARGHWCNHPGCRTCSHHRSTSPDRGLGLGDEKWLFNLDPYHGFTHVHML